MSNLINSDIKLYTKLYCQKAKNLILGETKQNEQNGK